MEVHQGQSVIHTYIYMCTGEDAENLTCRICVNSFVETGFSFDQNNPGDPFKQSLVSSITSLTSLWWVRLCNKDHTLELDYMITLHLSKTICLPFMMYAYTWT